MSTVELPPHVVAHPAGFLVAKDTATQVTVELPLPEKIDSLQKKIFIASAYDPSIEFSYKEAPAIHEFAPLPTAPLPTAPLPAEEMSSWVEGFCKGVRAFLYSEAYFNDNIPPYPLLSATYQGWIEEELEEEEVITSNLLQEGLKKAPEGSSLEDLMKVVLQIAKAHDISSTVLRSCALYLSSKFERTTAIQIELMLYEKLGVEPSIKLDDPLYEEWAKTRLTAGEIATFQEILEWTPRRRTVEELFTHKEEGNYPYRSRRALFSSSDILFEGRKVHPSTITALSRTLSENSFKEAELARILNREPSTKSPEEIESEVYKNMWITLDSSLYEAWKAKNLGDEQRKTSDALMACISGIPLPPLEERESDEWERELGWEATTNLFSTISKILEENEVHLVTLRAFFFCLAKKLNGDAPSVAIPNWLLSHIDMTIQSKLYDHVKKVWLPNPFVHETFDRLKAYFNTRDTASSLEETLSSIASLLEDAPANHRLLQSLFLTLKKIFKETGKQLSTEVESFMVRI